jgi:hypothetical protein
MSDDSNGTDFVSPAAEQPTKHPYYLDYLRKNRSKRRPEATGSAVTISYSFADVAPSHMAHQIRDFTPFSDAERATTIKALNYISSFANITFVRAPPGKAEINFANVNREGAQSRAMWTIDDVRELFLERGGR